MKLQLLAALLVLPCVAMAQSPSATETNNATATPPPPPGGMHQPPDPARQLEHLTKELDLTAAQQEKIKPILEDSAAKAKAIHDANSSDPAAMKTAMEALHKETSDKIEPELTNDQVAKFKAMHHHGPHGDNGAPPPPPPAT